MSKRQGKRKQQYQPAPKSQKPKPSLELPSDDTPINKVDLSFGQLRQMLMVQISSSYSGPIPTASEMQGHENASPGAAKQIINMAIEDQRSGNALRDKQSDQAHYQTILGQICSTIIVLALVGGAVYCISTGNELAAAGFGLAAVSPIIGLLIKRK